MWMLRQEHGLLGGVSDNLGLQNSLGLTLSMTLSRAVAQWSPQQPCHTKKRQPLLPFAEKVNREWLTQSQTTKSWQKQSLNS